MSLTELLPSLKDLNKIDKLRAVQFLVHDLAKEERALFGENEECPVWSPYGVFAAAGALLEALASEKVHA